MKLPRVVPTMITVLSLLSVIMTVVSGRNDVFQCVHSCAYGDQINIPIFSALVVNGPVTR